jgi:hypothetical protein
MLAEGRPMASHRVGFAPGSRLTAWHVVASARTRSSRTPCGKCDRNFGSKGHWKHKLLVVLRSEVRIWACTVPTNFGIGPLAPTRRQEATTHDHSTTVRFWRGCRAEPGDIAARAPRGKTGGRLQPRSSGHWCPNRMSSCARPSRRRSGAQSAGPHPVVVTCTAVGWAFGSPASFRKLDAVA